MKLALLRPRSLAFAFLALASGLAAACAGGDGSSSSTNGANAAASGDGGPSVASSVGGSGGAVPEASPACQPQPGPDRPDDNFTDSNCDGIDGDASRAIFVAPTGSDSATGSIGAPVKSVAKAVALAAAQQKDVYLCDATYTEPVELSNAAVNLYGGYDCANGWHRGNDHATFVPAAGYPLFVHEVASALVVDRVALRAADASAPGTSSVAAFVRKSPNVSFNHVSFAAGQGADGIVPAAPVAATTPPGPGLDGDSRVTAVCSHAGQANCTGQASGGGFNFASARLGGRGGDGGNTLENAPAGNGATGGVNGGGGAGGIGALGHRGADGANGNTGLSSTDGIGSIGPDGYAASNSGTDGEDGKPGQGGGGGAGGYSYTTQQVTAILGGGGGQGGTGGAGGAGAKGSGGGGASIGLLVVDSGVTLNNCKVSASNGGRGGDSVAGAAGQPGGAPGNGGKGSTPGYGDGFAGGAGGNGGRGGAGGAGGGGPSIGILTNSGAPMMSGTTFNTAQGGDGGHGNGGADGAPGDTHDVFVLGAPTDGGIADASHD